MNPFQELCDLIDKGILSFQNDPPDTDFQRGYLACLRELEKQYGAILLDHIRPKQ